MFSFPKRLAGVAVAWALSALVAAQPALAQGRQISFVRDTEIEHILRTFATPILETSGIVPDAVTIALVRDDTLNAFVAGGQNIFWHTGILMETELDQLIGVMAHEVGHIAGGHLARTRDALENASTIAMLSTLLGMAAAIGAGRGDVGAGVMGGGQEAARRTFFAFTRTQEGSADEFATETLERLGWPATGMLSMFEKLAGQELLPETRQVEYVRTHPLTRNRIENVRNFIRNESKHSKSRFPPHFYEMHARMQAKLVGFIRPELALRRYSADDKAMAPRYARAIALYQKGSIPQALELIDGLIREEPRNAYFHELKGQILFENGRPAEAVGPYREAVKLMPESGLLRSALSHALLEVGDDRLIEEAVTNLRDAARLERRSAFVWRLLASAYSRADMQPQLAYARAEEALARGDIRAAKFHADRAEQMLPAGSPEWIRAQDIRVIVESRVNVGFN